MRVFSFLRRVTLSRGECFKNPSTTASVRPVVLTSLTSARSKPPTSDEEGVNNQPIKFSTSKASHRTWKVSRSMGIQHERPWWRALPITLLGTTILLWCFLREETDIDKQLDKQLHEQIPGLISEDEEKSK